jgi:membrane-bound serine protease (ClpP class)
MFHSYGPALRTLAGRSPARRTAALALLLLGLVLLALPTFRASAQDGAPVVRVIELDNSIDVVSARYLGRAIEAANEDNVELIVITLDTPGGSLDSTNDMVGDIMMSRTPVVVFVSPEGAQAASAGTFISAASGLLAMAPATRIGAAAVVDASGEDLPETLGNKVTQDAAAFMRDIATTRGRNVEALEKTVTEALAYSATEAVELDIADLIASDLTDLLQQVDGRSIPASGGPVAVSTTGAEVQERDMPLLDRFLEFLASPNVAFLLISLGTLALFVEILHPGLWIPGTIGIAFLILGFAGVGNLDFSWAGVAFLALAIVLIILEAQAPGFSYFGAAGVIALVLGGVFLVGRFSGPDLTGGAKTVSLWLLAVVGASAFAFVVWLTWQIRLTRRSPAYVSEGSTGALAGHEGIVTARLAPKGEVHIAGEYWTAETAGDVPLEVGEKVKVLSVDGVTLIVEPVREDFLINGGSQSRQSV